MKIAVYSFSTSGFFFKKLIDKYAREAEWFVFLPRGHFRFLFKGIEKDGHVGYLYSDFNERYRRARLNNNLPTLSTDMTFSQALLRDKGGYRFLSQREQLRRVAVMSEVYKLYLERWRPNVVVFPDVETVDGFVLWGLCRQLKIPTACVTGMRFLNRSFFSDGLTEQLPSYFGSYEKEDRALAERLVTLALENRWSEFIIHRANSLSDPAPLPSMAARVWRSAVLRFGSESLHKGEDTVLLALKRAGLRFLNPFRQQVFDRIQSRFFDITPQKPDFPERFVYFPLHVTPESSINGLSPYYVDQLRAIDQLVLSLPEKYFILVKEHPAMMGTRESRFYRELQKKPGVLLVHPKISSFDLIRRSSIVSTVTGTVGLECFFLDKPCILFGSNFFKHLCLSWEERASGSGPIAGWLENYRPPSLEQKIVEIAKLVNIGDEFSITDPLVSQAVLSPENLSVAWNALQRHLKRGGFLPC